MNALSRIILALLTSPIVLHASLAHMSQRLCACGAAPPDRLTSDRRSSLHQQHIWTGASHPCSRSRSKAVEGLSKTCRAQSVALTTAPRWCCDGNVSPVNLSGARTWGQNSTARDSSESSRSVSPACFSNCAAFHQMPFFAGNVVSACSYIALRRKLWSSYGLCRRLGCLNTTATTGMQHT